MQINWGTEGFCRFANSPSHPINPDHLYTRAVARPDFQGGSALLNAFKKNTTKYIEVLNP